MGYISSAICRASHGLRSYIESITRGARAMRKHPTESARRARIRVVFGGSLALWDVCGSDDKRYPGEGCGGVYKAFRGK